MCSFFKYFIFNKYYFSKNEANTECKFKWNDEFNMEKVWCVFLKVARMLVHYLWEFLVIIRQSVDGVVEDLLHESLLLVCVEVQLGHLHGVRLAVLLTEAEHDDWRKLPLKNHLHNLVAVALWL